MTWNHALAKAFTTKPYSVILSDVREGKLERSLSLLDLLCIGVGGTVGSGIFVLTGLIARDYAGPGVVFSWILAGVGCCASALSYAELSCVIPSAGSSYAYVFVGLGELPAFIAAWCLTLEYGISGAAVASSWGDKVQAFISLWSSEVNLNPAVNGFEINIIGSFLQFIVMILLLRGVNVSKTAINFFTLLKLLLISFIIIGGFVLFNSNNFQPWTPFGMKGVFRGAASCFFGYLGYDEVCCLAGEAKNPQKNLPRAVLGTIGIVTVIYVLGAIVIIGMEKYQDIDSESGFSVAFGSNGWIWAQDLVAIGEIITLPLVVLVSFLAQPRLQFALAEDGLLPSILAEVDSKGSLVKGILISGILCIVVTAFVPFSYLDDMISAGVLLSFNLTNTSLLVLRFSKSLPIPNNRSFSNAESNKYQFFTGFLDKYVFYLDNDDMDTAKISTFGPYLLLAVFHLLSILLCGLVSSTGLETASMEIITSICIFGIILAVISTLLYTYFPRFEYHSQRRSREFLRTSLTSTNGYEGSRSMDFDDYDENSSSEPFQVPLMPFIPLAGIFINYYLIAQLSVEGLYGIAIYIVIAIIIYFSYSIRFSIGATTGWSSSTEYKRQISENDSEHAQAHATDGRDYRHPLNPSKSEVVNDIHVLVDKSSSTATSSNVESDASSDDISLQSRQGEDLRPRLHIKKPKV